jgi:molybdate transport system substrate-binding protein
VTTKALLGLLLWVAASCALGCQARAAPEEKRLVRVAAAANVQDVVRRIAERFEAREGAKVELSAGSSGKLYAQIENGAPFDVFVSADTARPARLEALGRAVAGSRFSYADGRLAGYGPALRHPTDGAADLREGAFRHLAIAHPDTAPYGAAAVEVLQALGVWQDVSGRLVRGENVAQTLQFVETGGAELGLVALSTVSGRAGATYWKVPVELHRPIRQDAVLLARASDHPAARAFLDFLRGAEAKRLFEAAGYDVPP